MQELDIPYLQSVFLNGGCNNSNQNMIHFDFLNTSQNNAEFRSSKISSVFLRKLGISGFDDTSLSLDLQELPNLELLEISQMSELTALSFITRKLKDCETLNMYKLKQLIISHTRVSEILLDSTFAQLSHLIIANNFSLQAFPQPICFPNLQILDISGTSIETIPNEISLCSELRIFKCNLAKKIRSIKPVYSCTKLASLYANSVTLNHKIILTKWKFLQILELNFCNFLSSNDLDGDNFDHFESFSFDHLIFQNQNLDFEHSPAQVLFKDTGIDASEDYSSLQFPNLEKISISSFKDPNGIIRPFLQEKASQSTINQQLVEPLREENSHSPSNLKLRLSPSKSKSCKSSQITTCTNSRYSVLFYLPLLKDLSLTFSSWTESQDFVDYLAQKPTSLSKLESLSISGLIKTSSSFSFLESLQSIVIGPGILEENSEAFTEISRLKNLASFTLKHVSRVNLPDIFEEFHTLKEFMCSHVEFAGGNSTFPKSIFRSKTLETVVFDVESDLYLEIPDSFPPPSLQVFMTGRKTTIECRNDEYSQMIWQRYWKRT